MGERTERMHLLPHCPPKKYGKAAERTALNPKPRENRTLRMKRLARIKSHDHIQFHVSDQVISSHFKAVLDEAVCGMQEIACERVSSQNHSCEAILLSTYGLQVVGGQAAFNRERIVVAIMYILMYYLTLG